MKPHRAPTGPGEESVWDYPRPPRLEPTSKRLVARFAGQVIADTTSAFRVLETSHPPNYYIPPEDVRWEWLEPAPGGSLCEWKGRAAYLDVVVGGRRAEKVAWRYPEPTPRFAAMAGYVAFYAAPMDVCTVDGEPVAPQPGGFYGGWITSDVKGPFKGAPGTWGW